MGEGRGEMGDGGHQAKYLRDMGVQISGGVLLIECKHVPIKPLPV